MQLLKIYFSFQSGPRGILLFQNMSMTFIYEKLAAVKHNVVTFNLFTGTATGFGVMENSVAEPTAGKSLPITLPFV